MELIKSLQTPGWFETWEIVLTLVFILWAIGRAGQSMVENPEKTRVGIGLLSSLFRK